MTEYLAKSEQYGKETIEKHTLSLIRNHEILKKNIKNNNFTDDFWNLSKTACLLHDLGKYNDKFQEKIKEGHYTIENEIPHAFLSVAYIPKTTNKEDVFSLFYAIAYHHERKINFSQKEYENTIKNDLANKLRELKWLKPESLEINEVNSNLFNFLNKNTQQYIQLINPKNKEQYKKFILLKGLLHKCDYSASAHIEPEKPYDGNYNNDFTNWLPFELKSFQKDAKTLSEDNKSVVLIASTGVGKTEYSMNWINGKKGNKKAFYLLGLKMATNKMFERFSDIFNCHGRDNVTLLHSSAGDILFDDNEDVFSYFNKRSRARQLSYPITLATADQLVTSVFKYPGFELKYFTASYSHIVVDEIQSFAPEAIASIVVFLQEIHKLGGRFLLMTATLPPFVKGDLKNLTDIKFPEHEEQLSSQKRHKIQLINEEIEENISEYIQNDKKILIICNTVKKAQKIAGILENEGYNPKLLHSKFIVKDRAKKENEIMKDAPNGKNEKKSVIWISTQIVEASLDIDFDLLLTENATIDSLFQRFGRAYRNRDYTKNEANIFIFRNDDISKRIYDKDIMKRSWDILKNYDGKLLTEEDKQDIINKVFDESFIEKTKYYENYNSYKKLLKLGFRADSKGKAQEMFRKITNQYLVIPEPVYLENMDKIDEQIGVLDSKKDSYNNNREYFEKRIKAEQNLMKFTIGVQLWKKVAEESLISEYFSHSQYCIKKKLFVLKNCNYDYKNGLILLKESEAYDNIL